MGKEAEREGEDKLGGVYEVQKRKRLSLVIKKSWGFRTWSIVKTD